MLAHFVVKPTLLAGAQKEVLDRRGTLKHAQTMAAHEGPRITVLYDRTKERLTLDEIERIVI
jgi:hypothetical protein